MADPKALMQKAQNALAKASSSGWGFTRLVSGGNDDKYHNAADLFVQAANAFRMQQMNDEAGTAFIRAATIYKENCKEPLEAANAYVDAFKAFRMGPDRAGAVDALNEAIQLHGANGNLRRAATFQENLGEMLEAEDPNNPGTPLDLAGAIKAYTQAATWYDGDNSPKLGNKDWMKVAELSAVSGDYKTAAARYEQAAKLYLADSTLGMYSAKEPVFRAAICSLATGDTVLAQRDLERLAGLNQAFTAQWKREYQLLTDLRGDVEQGEPEAFADALYAYDQTNHLDPWKVEMFTRIKTAIAEQDNEFS